MESILPGKDGGEDQKKQAAAAANDTRAGAGAGVEAERDAPARGRAGDLVEFADPPPLGACQVLVHAIDARDLAPRDSNNSSDPVVKVLCAYSTMQSRKLWRASRCCRV